MDGIPQYLTKSEASVTSILCWGWMRSQGTERAAVHGQSSVEEFALNLTRISATNLSFFTNIRGITLLSACPVVLQEMLKASSMKRLSKGIDYFLFSPFPPSLFHSWQRRFHLSEPAARASFTCAPLGWVRFMNTAAELKRAWDL